MKAVWGSLFGALFTINQYLLLMQFPDHDLCNAPHSQLRFLCTTTTKYEHHIYIFLVLPMFTEHQHCYTVIKMWSAHIYGLIKPLVISEFR